MTDPDARLDAIHAMLAAGHRCVHVERHSVLLLGALGGFLALATDTAVNAERFPEVREHAAALLVWLALWLGGASLLDHRLTQRARQRRAETLPFAQAQITRAWWMLLAMGILGTFAMFFYGGGAMVYALWIVLLGLGVYLFGLFARPLLEWIGLAAMLLGVAALAAGLPFGTTRWLMASAFAVGVPLAGVLAQRTAEGAAIRRSAWVALWLTAVAVPPLALDRILQVAAPGKDDTVLRFDAGTRLPLRFDLDSTVVGIDPAAGVDLVLRHPVEAVFAGDAPEGRYRIGDGPWQRLRDGAMFLSIDRIQPRLAGGRPEVRMHGAFGTREFPVPKP